MAEVLNSEEAGRNRPQDETRPAPQLLDKEGLAAELLECADEKIISAGQVRYANDARDRLGFLRLYAEVMGFVGKSVNALSNEFTNNEMKVVLVRPENKPDNQAIKPAVNKVDDSATVIPLRIRPV